MSNLSQMSQSRTLSSRDAKRAARNVSTLMVASLLGKGALFLWQILLTALLGKADYGIYGLVGGLMATAGTVASFGMGLIVIRDVAQDRRQAGKYWTAMLFTQTVLALLAYVGMNSSAIFYSETARVFVALAGINLFIDIFGNMGHDLLLAQEEMVKTSLVEILHIGLRIGLAWLALTAGWGLLAVYGAAIVSGSLRAGALVLFNLRAGIRPEFPLDGSIARPLLLNSAPLAASAFLSLAYNHSDKLLTTGILGETANSDLTLAFVINFGAIELLSTTVLVAAYPLLARYYEAGRNPFFGFMIEKLALYMLLVGLPLALSVSILADKILPPLLPAYAPSAGILRLLIWYTALTIFGNVFSKGLLIQNRQRRLLAIRAASLALNILVTTILLLQWRDPRGAAVASIVGELLTVGLLLRSFRAPGWQPRRITGSAGRLLLIAAPTALLLWALREQFFMLPLLCGLACYSLGILRGRVLGQDDWDLLYRLAAAMPGAAILLRYWKRDLELSG